MSEYFRRTDRIDATTALTAWFDFQGIRAVDAAQVAIQYLGCSVAVISIDEKTLERMIIRTQDAIRESAEEAWLADRRRSAQDREVKEL